MRASSLEKTLMLGRVEGKRRRGWQRMRWLDSFTASMDIVKVQEAWHAAVHGITNSQTRLSNGTATKYMNCHQVGWLLQILAGDPN